MPCFQWLGVLGDPQLSHGACTLITEGGKEREVLAENLKAALLCTIAPMVYPQGFSLKAKGKHNCSNTLVKLCSGLIKFYTGFDVTVVKW